MKLLSIISKVVSDIYNSFFTNKEGMAARKLSAFVVLMFTLWQIDKHATTDNIYEIALLLLFFVAFCLGLVTFGEILKFKNGSSESTSTTKTETEITETNKTSNEN